MLLWGIVALVFLAGCAGGVVNSLIAGEFQLPRLDSGANVFRPGWIGTCLVGGIAALTFWGLYGPLTNASIMGGGLASPPPALKIGELFGSLITGIGGGRLLSSEIDRQGLKNQNEALVATKNQLAETIGKLAGYVEAKS
jgi:hypothetical protein